MKKNLSMRLAVVGMTAAAYFVITMALSGLAFREVQFRVSEILNLLAFINPIFAPGVILGCFLANLFSPFGLPDIIFGTIATSLAVFLITRTKNLLIAAIWPIACNIIVAGEIFFIFTNPPWELLTFLVIAAGVLGGEAVVMLGLGYPLFIFLRKNDRLMNFLKNI